MKHHTCLKSEPLQTERLKTGRRMLLRDLIVCADGTDWEIPKDTETDFSSIPSIGRAIIKWSRVDIAGVVHDWLYAEGDKTSRARADRIWRLVAMAGDHHANAFQAWIGYLALRGYGAIAWAGHRKTKAAWCIAITEAALSTLFLLSLIGAVWLVVPKPEVFE